MLLLNLIRIRKRIYWFKKKTGGLKLNHNFLSGTVPSEFSRLKKLTSLSLYSNDLSGNIPNSVCETFNTTYPEFEADCIDFDDDCACCTSCCVEDTCVCRYLGTPKEFLCYNQWRYYYIYFVCTSNLLLFSRCWCKLSELFL